MKRLASLFLFLAGPVLILGAQSSTPDEIKSSLIAFSAKVSSLDCDFVQTRTSSLLAGAVSATGHMTYRKPGYLKWEYAEPDPLTFIADGERISLERNGQAETLSGNQNRMIKEMTRLIINNIEGSVLSDEKLFRTEITNSDDSITVILYPQRNEARRMWSKFVLHYDPKSMHATGFEMHETSGDLTVIAFNHVDYAF